MVMKELRKKVLYSGQKARAILIFISTIALIMGGCASVPKVGKTKATRGRYSPKVGLKILGSAKSQIGKKYRFGGKSPKTGFDCSGLAWWSHKKNNIKIPRESYSQYRSGKKIKIKDLMPGDLLYFTTYRKGASHVGIYDGRGGFIHSPNSRKKVQRTSLSNSYYKKRYLGARRYW
jgi:uncharacterized protein YceK